MDIEKIISQMTLEEKASMCSGEDFWHTEAIERLGVPSSMVSDGPHGLRKQDMGGDNLGVNDSIKAVCFPAACATSSSFDKELIEKMGEALGEECQHEGVSVILGPAVNIKRSPLCGRNFEYFSEDPYLATKMAGAEIKGVQSKNVGTSLKHFPANNQEYRRMSTDSVVDERTLREIYLAAFEGAIKEQQPWTVMCSYNKINGIYGCENPFTLDQVLRKEWGFKGYVVSDWGAVDDRVESLKAGLDLEMPSSFGENDKLIVKAVKEGKLDEAVVDEAVRRVLSIVDKFEATKEPGTPWDMDEHHALSKKVAGECAVLLKNEDNVLPLSNDGSIAFIGKYAKMPRFQGGGSSHINCFKKESAMDAVADPTMNVRARITYSQGYDDKEDVTDEKLLREAVMAAKDSDVAVVFAGLPDNFESEGYDRKHMRMPECQNRLISEVAAVQPHTVVVLHGGSPMEMPWIDEVQGVLMMYLGGQAVGGATVDLLFGRKNPSGHLAETFPLRLEDTPCFLNYPGLSDVAVYSEGVYVGYRYYDKKKIDVLFPFGHGLSYTDFRYSNLRLSADECKASDKVKVKVNVTNTGRMAGKAVVQLYVKAPENECIDRPVRELRGFEKVELLSGETKEVTLELNRRSFAYWDVKIHDWHVLSGDYEIEIGESSRNIVLSKTLKVTNDKKYPVVFDYSSPMGDIAKYPEAKKLLDPLLKSFMFGGNVEGGESSAEAITEEMQAALFDAMPIRNLLSFGEGTVTNEMIFEIIDKINALKIEE